MKEGTSIKWVNRSNYWELLLNHSHVYKNRYEIYIQEKHGKYIVSYVDYYPPFKAHRNIEIYNDNVCVVIGLVSKFIDEKGVDWLMILVDRGIEIWWMKWVG